MSSPEPADCLRYLRFLELAFSPYSHDNYPTAGHPSLRDWAETLHWARDKLNQPALTVRLVMNKFNDWFVHREVLTRAQCRETVEGFMRIASPLASLDELGRFYADFSRSEGNMELPDSAMSKMLDRELNINAEKRVLGDRYKEVSSCPGFTIWQDYVYLLGEPLYT